MLGRTTLGAIDAGSNAIRVVVAELTATDLLRIEAERVPIRLGHNAFTVGELSRATIDQAVGAFVHFREMFDRHGVSIYRAVATSAVRAASNRDELLHRLYHEAGIELEIIEGEEEARLVRKAVIHAFGSGPTGGPARCIFDLGGGSLEVNLREGAVWRGYSLPIGTVRLLESFGLSGAIGDAEAGMVRRYAATVMKSVLPARPLELAVAAAAGGNADTLARLLGDGHPTMPTIELASLEKALPEILGATIDERMAKFEVRRDRAEVMGIAALVLATVSRQLGIQKLIAPGVGVREAVLLELAEAAREEKARAEGAIDKALLTAARSFANRVDHDTTHGEQVRKLSKMLFQQLRDVHELPDELAVVLEVAALLHDIGEVVNTRGHHKHSEYMIRWGRIPGLEPVQREMIALLARTHRKPIADVKHIIGDADLPKERRQQVRRLCALLRLADGLDCEHRQRVDHVVCARVGDAIVLDLVVRDGPARGDDGLIRKADMFRDELGLDVRLTVGRSPAPQLEGNGKPAPLAS
jgi:exopolyphosphatase/guanosine-5'-triphosphate,3'-diphosphate pyrophosphatase